MLPNANIFVPDISITSQMRISILKKVYLIVNWPVFAVLMTSGQLMLLDIVILAVQ